MKINTVKKLISCLIAAALILSVLPFGVFAEPGFRGGITKVDLTVDREPYIASDNSANHILFSASVANDNARYEVNPKNVEYSSFFKNGVAWYDETEGNYVNDPNYIYYGYNLFYLIHTYRVEIVVRITGSIIHESSWFKVYGEGDNWDSAVTATVNGHEATVSPYLNYDLNVCMLVSYTFGPTLPENSYASIQVIEGQVDAPRGGRVASFDAAAGGYQSNYKVSRVEWWDNTVLEYLNEGDTFTTGHTYTVAIHFAVNDEFRQSFNPRKFFINGNEARLRESHSSSTTACVLEYTFSNIREAPEDYRSLQVYGVCGPIGGITPAMVPQVSVTCDNSAGSNCELVPDKSEFYHKNVCWVDADTYTPLDIDEPFVKGKKYILIVPVRTTGDNRFAVIKDEDRYFSDMFAEFIPSIGEGVISTKIASSSQSGRELDRVIYAYFEFPACEQIVYDVSFSAQTPKEGEQINKNVVSGDSSKYRAKNISWIDDTTGHIMETGETFTANHNYSLTFEVYTASGYIFPAGYGITDVRGNSIDINEAIEGIISYKANYAEKDGPHHSFIITCDMGLCNDSVIEELAFKVTAPMAGQTPSYNVLNLGSGYHTTGWEGKTEQYWLNPVTYAYYGRNGVQWWDEDSSSEHMYENETFIEGHRYTVCIYVEADDGYEFAHNKYYEPLATAMVNGNQAEDLSGGSQYTTRQTVKYTFVCGKSQGYTVSGTVKSTSDPDSPAIVRLTKAGYSEPDYETELYGTSASFSFSGVENGTYTLYVTKSGYTAVSRTVTVSGGSAEETITLTKPQQGHIPGDINDDGKVNNKDLTRLFQKLSGWNVEVVEAALDVNGDGKVNNKDLTRLFQYLSGWNVQIS